MADPEGSVIVQHWVKALLRVSIVKVIAQLESYRDKMKVPISEGGVCPER
jgi:hypothetical protein